MSTIFKLITTTAAETERIGRRLAPLLRAGDVVYLIGPLGAGKSVLARGVIQALAGEDIDVPSPTFSLVQTYATRPPITHADLFRLEMAEEVMELGLDEAALSGILLVEWPDKGEGYLPRGGLTIFAEEQNGDRLWVFAGAGDWPVRLQQEDLE